MAMNRDTTRTRHPLPCGSDVEGVWDDMEAGRTTAHRARCPHCTAARASLEQLAEATALLVDDPVEPPAGLLDQIMSAVRADLARAESLPLPAPSGGVEISTLTLASVLRFAVDQVPGLRAHRCRIDTDPGISDTVHVSMSVSLRFGSARATDLDDARRRVRAVLSARIGLTLGTLDFEVVDVWLDGAHPAAEGPL